MSRSGYVDDCDYSDYALALWRGAVASAIRGKRGQRLLKDLLAALDAMPVKRLIANDLVREGEYCALGVLGAKRGLPIDRIDPEERDAVAGHFDIAPALAAEVVYENDEAWPGYWSNVEETPEHRWKRMRAWVAEQIAVEGRPK